MGRILLQDSVAAVRVLEKTFSDETLIILWWWILAIWKGVDGLRFQVRKMRM